MATAQETARQIVGEETPADTAAYRDWLTARIAAALADAQARAYRDALELAKKEESRANLMLTGSVNDMQGGAADYDRMFARSDTAHAIGKAIEALARQATTGA